MFKTRPHDVTRSAPVVGRSQNVGAVNADDDDGERDCGEDKQSYQVALYLRKNSVYRVFQKFGSVMAL